MKKVALVVGMCRSGAHLLSRSLQIFGAKHSKDFHSGDEGYTGENFNDSDISKLNKEVLATIGQTWDNLEPLSKADLDFILRRGFVDKALQILNKRNEGIAFFALREPIIAKLLPFWMEVFKQLDIDVKYIFVLRNPLNVARSLRKHDKLDMTKGLMLWLSDNIFLLQTLDGTNVHFINYDDFLEEPIPHMDNLSIFLEADQDQKERKIFLESFLDKGLHHSGDAKEPLSDREFTFANIFDLLKNIPSGKFDYSLVSKHLHEYQTTLLQDFYVASQIEMDLNKTLQSDMVKLNFEKKQLNGQIIAIKNSRSWKITAPLRKILGFIHSSKLFAFFKKKHEMEQTYVQGAIQTDSIVNTFEYLKKYTYALNNVPECLPSDTYKNCIWQMWWQGAHNAPPMVKACFNSVAMYHPEKQRIIIDESNFSKYVEIPDYILEKLENGIITKTHFSDYIRLCLLVKYGGTWIDATVLLTDRIPEQIFAEDFFAFKYPLWCCLEKVPSEGLLSCLSEGFFCNNKILSFSSWFIHATPQEYFLRVVKHVLSEYWKNENHLMEYFLIHYIVTFVAVHDAECKKIFENIIAADNIKPHILQQILFHGFNEDIFKEVRALSSIHKLTYKGLENNVLSDSFLKKIIRM